MSKHIKISARGALAVSLIAASACAVATPAAADAVGEFYKGKSISLVIGFPPLVSPSPGTPAGGGADPAAFTAASQAERASPVSPAFHTRYPT